MFILVILVIAVVKLIIVFTIRRLLPNVPTISNDLAFDTSNPVTRKYG